MKPAALSEPRLFGSVLYGADETVIQFVCERLQELKGLDKASSLGVVRNNKLIAGIVYTDFTGHNIHMSIASDDAGWLTRNVLKHAFGYPFNQLGVERITCTIARKNKRSRKLCKGVGFVEEGKVRRGYDGKQDMMIYGLLKQECRFLG